MKILSARQTHQLDNYTIQHEPIAARELMERASTVFVRWFMTVYADRDRPIYLFCGTGNNGGDGLVVARLLHEALYTVRVYLCEVGEESDDRAANRDRLAAKRVVETHTLQPGTAFPDIPAGAIIVDALFGSGLSRPVTGYWAELIDYLNEQVAERVAIDIPSGVFADRHTEGTAFRADRTLSFELPKLAFFMPENGDYIGQWAVRSIGLATSEIERVNTPYHYLSREDCESLLRKRKTFEHKGTFGHALIVAGSYGKMGACTLCARAALRAGAGLVSVHAPRCGYEILQIAFPEAMVEVDKHRYVCSHIGEVEKYDSLGVGPGLGQNEVTVAALRDLLKKADYPLVIDADALNIISKNPELFDELPPNSLLTPHPKEFERLFGKTENDFARLELLREKAQELRCIIILKTGRTAIGLPTGEVWFNATGNPGMGTAGTGDVLTGILTGLLAQPYTPEVAAKLGVYLHGLAGDIAADELEQESLIAEDVIRYLGRAFKALKRSEG